MINITIAMRKVAIIVMLLITTITLAACKKKSPMTGDGGDNTMQGASGDEQILDTATDDTEITDEDIKMIEDFLNEVVKSVEGDTAS